MVGEKTKRMLIRATAVAARDFSKQDDKIGKCDVAARVVTPTVYVTGCRGMSHSAVNILLPLSKIQ